MSILRSLVDCRDKQVQKARLAFGERKRAIDQGRDEADDLQREKVERYYELFQDLEKELDGDIDYFLSLAGPIVEHIEAIKGISHTLCAKLLAHIDIALSPTVSALWRYAGYGLVENGDGNLVAERPQKGEKLHYNKRLKTTVWLITKSFLMSGSPYRELYDIGREHYDRTHPDWTDGHKHNAALRKMAKVFLSHLWVRWRTMEGLSVTEPYIDRQMSGPHAYGPEHYGWPELAKGHK